MLSQDDDKVGLYFVIPSECKTKDECATIMLNVYEACEKHGLGPEWLSEAACLTLEPDKRNVFVFQKFEGEAFNHLEQFKCVLVGPQCIETILKENTTLPHLPRPYFTMAMSGLIITASGFGPKGKEKMKEMIELMAGHYKSQLRPDTTHLIVKSVQSEKYFKAIAMNVTVMTDEWIDAVYTASVKGYVRATDPQFDAFKCPPFKGLLVSSSKLSASHKKKVPDLIEANGGKHVGSLTANVKLLVITMADGEKFRYARAWNIPCVTPKYVYDSVELGRALHVEDYEIKGLQTSSPEKAQRPDPNFSTISSIALPERSRVDETLMSSMMSDASTSTSYFKTPLQPRNVPSGDSGVFVRPQVRPPRPSSPSRLSAPDESARRNLTPKKAQSPAQFKHLLDELDLNKTKQAGQFLDGCKVFLYGFNSEHEEKLRKVLKGSGASRFTELSESTTHVLLGDDCDKAFSKQLKELSYRPHIVTLQWLLQSVTLRRPANEELYSYAGAEEKNAAPETPSPLSKKGLALLQRGDESPIAERERAVEGAKLSSKMSSRFLKELREPDKTEVSDLTAFYRNESTSEPPAPIPPAHPAYRTTEVTITNDSKECSTLCSQNDQPVFAGLKFVVVGLEEEVVEETSKVIVQHCGQVVPRNYKGVPDYAVVPLTGTSVSAAGEIVTPLWLEDCVFHGNIIPVEYFHQPMSVHSGKYPLRGCVVGLSGYTRKERLFLMDMTRVLGGMAQEVFARKDNPEKNAKASTHLVCNAAEGSKFTAAKKWKLPAVTHLWLLDCCKTGRRSSVRRFLIDPNQEIVENLPQDDTDDAQTSGKSDTGHQNVPSAVISDGSSAVSSAGTSRRDENKTEEVPQVNVPVDSDPKTPLRPRALQRIAGEMAALSPFHVSTPDSPYGTSENPSPGERKRIKKWINRFPDYPQDSESKKRCSTPLNEIRKQVLAKIGVSTPQIPEEDKPSGKRTSDGNEESLPQSAKRARIEEMSGKPVGADTLPGNERASVPKNLFPGNVSRPDNVSRAEGQIEEANKLLQLALPISGITSVNSSTGNTNPSPIKEKIAAPRVPKEVSQPYDINWEDPVTAAEAKNEPRFKDGLNTVSSASSSKRKSLEEVEEKEDTPSKKSSMESKPENTDVPSEEAPKNRIFMLSNIDDRERYASMVGALGGKILQGVHFDKAMTHLVIDKPVRSEKLLASIATGKWVLDAAYIEDSFKAGKFLDEAEYEWGAPRNEKWKGLLRPGSTEIQLANAAYRWRKKLSGTGLGAFEGIRAVVGATSSRIESFRRLIEAGGGTVLPPSELETATHYFVDNNAKAAQNLDNPGKVQVYPLIHLNEFLMKGPPPKDDS